MLTTRQRYDRIAVTSFSPGAELVMSCPHGELSRFILVLTVAGPTVSFALSCHDLQKAAALVYDPLSNKCSLHLLNDEVQRLTIHNPLSRTVPPPSGNTTSTNVTYPTVTTADDHVSWQSTLCLITLSVGAMAQRSGADRFLSSDSLSPARTSPFVCLADIVLVFLWLIKGASLGMDTTDTLRWYRKRIGLLRGAADRELIQGIPVVTMSLSVLGPLP